MIGVQFGCAAVNRLSFDRELLEGLACLSALWRGGGGVCAISGAGIIASPATAQVITIRFMSVSGY